MRYPDAAWERARTVQEVILKALSGEIHWFRAADILGFSARTLRRWRERYEKHGYIGLVDKRRHSPSARRVAAPEVERLLRLYRERYGGCLEDRGDLADDVRVTRGRDLVDAFPDSDSVNRALRLLVRLSRSMAVTGGQTRKAASRRPQPSGAVSRQARGPDASATPKPKGRPHAARGRSATHSDV
jgi:transposase